MKILFFVWLFSPFGIYSIARPQQSPCDKSNRINKVILLWFAFTRSENIKQFCLFKRDSSWEIIKMATFNEELFAPYMNWLKNDLWEQLNQ